MTTLTRATMMKAGLAAGAAIASLATLTFMPAYAAAPESRMVVPEVQSLTTEDLPMDITHPLAPLEVSAELAPLPEPEPEPEPEPAPAPAPVYAPPANLPAPEPGTAQAYAHAYLAQHGHGESEFSCLVSLWNKESGWNYQAMNRSSGAYGIPQALPGGKMASAGADWETNPETQIRWGHSYITARYGTPCNAYAYSQQHGWY